MRSRQIVVIGASDDIRYNEEAYQIGQYIAKNHYVLINGGGGGIMEAASRGASDAKGVVIGILPGDNIDGSNRFCTISIPTGMGFARNIINILSADLAVAIGGKSGTLSELAYAWMYHKPVICCSFAQGWSKEFPGIRLDDRKGSTVYKASTVDEVCELITAFFQSS